MRSIIKSVVLATVIVAGMWGTWQLGVLITDFLKRPEAAAPPAQAVTKPPEPPAKVKPKARVAKVKPAEAEAVAPALAPPAAPRRVTPFPTAHDIHPGAGREELKAEFGEPSLRASLYDRGSLLETFVYQNQARSATTYARLRDGSVIGAATAGAP